MSQFENPYYGNSGGGGYLAGGSPFGSQNGSPGGSGGKRVAQHTLRPVTVKQLNDATQAHSDAEWFVDKAEIGQIMVVAMVASINAQTTNNVYWLDDGYGRIEARLWTDNSSEEDAGKWGGIEDWDCVCVTGSLKTFGNRRYINTTHIRKIPADEVCAQLCHHLYHVAYVTLCIERGPPNANGQAQATSVSNGVGGSSAYTMQSHGATDQFGHLPPLQRQIINFISRQPPNNDGIHVAAITRALANESGVDAHKISDALDLLMDDGLVFTTIDESHFKISE